MPEQLALVPSAPRLTDRQRWALELVTEAGGATATCVGLAWHVHRGKHDGRRPCSYCETDGRAVLRELRRKGLVVRRRSGSWQSLGGCDAAARSATPAPTGQSNVIPF